MKRSTIVFWGLVIGVLVLLNGYSLYETNRMGVELQEAAESLQSSQQRLQYMRENVITRETLQFNNERKSINGDLVLTTGPEEEVHTFHNLLLNEYTYVFDLGNIDCLSCIDDLEGVIGLVKELAGEVGDSKVLLLADFRIQQDLDLFKRLNQLSLNVYNKNGESFGLPVEEEETPYMFITRSDLVTHYLFVPDEEMPELSEIYFSFIEEIITSN